MFGISGAGLSKIRHMQNGGKRARRSIDQWDRVSLISILRQPRQDFGVTMLTTFAAKYVLAMNPKLPTRNANCGSNCDSSSDSNDGICLDFLSKDNN